MTRVGIVASGPDDHIPDLVHFEKDIDLWIGADRGALKLLEDNIKIDYAIGDFDSINHEEKSQIQELAKSFISYPSEKDETDLELAIEKALELKASTIYLFGVTGGRFDHTLINTQVLYTLMKSHIKGYIIDKWNRVELLKSGTHLVTKDADLPYISFIPVTEYVKGITLENFYYSIKDRKISWGETLCISNELTTNEGRITFTEGLLLLVKSKDLS